MGGGNLVTIVFYDLCANDSARRFSPACWKVRMALAHKGLDFEARATPYGAIKAIGDGFSPTVPVIDDDGKLMRESFDIALYLEDAYPDRPSLFGGAGGRAMARFVDSWSAMMIARTALPMIIKDVHDRLSPDDQAYFRASREKRFGRTLEDLQANREEHVVAWRAAWEPLRVMLGAQPFIGGDAPLYADYSPFAALQWTRVMSPFKLLEDNDPVNAWFGRCLDLFDGMGRSMPAAA